MLRHILLLACASTAWGASWWAESEAIPGIPASLNPDKSLHNVGSLAMFETRRNNLAVVVVVEEDWTPAALGYNESQANFDILAVWAGAKAGWTCGPACIHTIRSPGLKWQLISQLTASNFWPDLRARYRYIGFPDSDLRFEHCVLSAVFDAAAAHSLLLAQPSICQGGGSYTRQTVTYQRQGSALRFTNYVGMLSPVFDMQYFDQQVRPTLKSAQSGLGLDWCWSHRLGYPRDRIAVVDSVCAHHPVDPARLQPEKGKGEQQQPIDCARAAGDTRCKGGLYAAALARTGRPPVEEQATAWEACGYSAASAEAAGQQFQRPRTFGSVSASSKRPAVVGMTARLGACRAGLPRALAEARAAYLVAAQQQRAAAAAQGSWGYAPLLAATVVLAPLTVASVRWMFRAATGSGQHMQRSRSAARQLPL